MPKYRDLYYLLVTIKLNKTDNTRIISNNINIQIVITQLSREMDLVRTFIIHNLHNVRLRVFKEY